MKKTFTAYPSSYIKADSRARRERRKAQANGYSSSGREESQLLVIDGDWEVWTPNTFEASMYLGKLYGVPAKWDTCYIGNGDRYFNLFNSKGPLYIIVNKNTGEKYQLHLPSNMFYDQDDRNVGMDAFYEFCDEHPAIADYFNL